MFPGYVSKGLKVYYSKELTWLDVAVRVGLYLSTASNGVLPLHQRPFLLTLLLFLRPLPPRRARTPTSRLILLPAHLHPFNRRLIIMHHPQRLAHTQEQDHQPPFGKRRVVHQVRVDHVLEVAPSVVRQQHVHRLGGLVGAALRGDGVVHGGYDGRHVGEEPVGVDLAHGLLDGLGAEGAADLLESEELVARGVFYEVDV